MADIYTGSAATVRDSYQTLTSADLYSTSVQWAAFNKTPYTKAIGVEGFGVEAMQDVNKFGAASPTGRIIRYDGGKYALRGSVFATGPTAYHIGRLGSVNPELVEGGDEYAYSWHQLLVSEFIPEVDVDDNSQGLIDIKLQKMSGMKQKVVESFNYCLLGNSSAPDYGVYGPDVVYTDLPNLISVTQDRSVGAISTANSYWANQSKALTSVGGGGDLDRPIALQRGLNDIMLTASNLAESTNDYLILATQGAWQYYQHLAYADTIQGRGLAVSNKYDSAGIQHFMFNGNPMVYDPAVTVPYGATASTEAFYGIHIPSYFVSIRKEKNFKVRDWEAPRNHDLVRTLVSHIDTRYTPGVTARRPHFVLYNIPACPD